MTPPATIALLNWNGRDFRRVCLDRLLRQNAADTGSFVARLPSPDPSAHDLNRALRDPAGLTEPARAL